MIRKFLLIGSLLIAFHNCWAQKKTQDSLLTVLDHTTDLEQRGIIEANLIATSGGDFVLLKKGKQELAIAETAGIPEKQARALLMICNATFTMHDLTGLLDASLKGISLSQKMNNNFFLSRFFHMAALANVYAQDREKSISYSLQAARTAMKARDIAEAIGNYSNLESDYAEVKALDSAFYYTRLEFDLLPKVNSRQKWHLEQGALGDYAEVLSAAGKPDSALIYYRKDFEIVAHHGQIFNFPYTENNMARTFLAIGQTDSAKKYALLSYQQASKNKIWEFTADVANILTQIYEGRDQKQYIYYLKAEVAAKDSSNAADKSRQFQVIADRDRQRQEDLKSAQEKFNTRIRFYAVIAAALVLLIVGALLWRNNRRQQQVNQLLSDQKEEISAQRDTLEQALSELKSTQTQLIQSEKMASLGELTAGIAHEIQNPLNFVNNFSEVNQEMLSELDEELIKGDFAEARVIAADIRSNEEKINHHGKRADAIVKSMLQHSKAGSGTKEPTNINTLADEYLRLAYHGFRSKDKDINAAPIAIGMLTKFDAKLPMANVIPQDIGRVLLNLFNNAFYAVNQRSKTAGPDYKPEVSVSTEFANGQVLINVKDNGVGIPDAIKEKIMQPFFTTKPTGEGTGLGLSLSYDIVVKGHGGKIEIDTKEGQFTEFSVYLPV